jgi:hypothetical protein
MKKILGLAVLMALAAGCTAPTPGGSASPVSPPTVAVPTPSPSPSLDSNQAAAAAALDAYQATKDKLFADPSKYSTHDVNAMLGKYAGYYMVQGNAKALAGLRKTGDRFSSGPVVVWVKVSAVIDNHNERGLEAHITVCHDKTAMQHLARNGTVLGTPSQQFSVRQFSVRKPGNAWRVFGETASSGECHR